MSNIITKASEQWASRPDDQRFTSLEDLNAFVKSQWDRSKALVVPNSKVSLAPTEVGNGLAAIGPGGSPVALTNWSFGQLAARVNAPAGYLRTLPAPVAADCFNASLRTKRIEDMGVLLGRDETGVTSLRAVTGPNYGRVWNGQITQALLDRFGDSDFTVPGIFGKPLETVTKRDTTLYASDRDMFVFLADEKNRIEMPNRRNGETGTLARGFFVWNSEVGSTTLGVATFLFDYVCANRIVWGAKEYAEIKLRHTVSAPERFIEEVRPALQRYVDSSTASIDKALADARSAKIDDVTSFLASRFTKSQVVAIQDAHMLDEGRPIETLWDAATGVTAYARDITYANDRVDLEREAGRILDLAA